MVGTGRELLHFLARGLETLASICFETRAVGDSDDAPALTDEACILKRPRDGTDR
jgi:hypothetical protein